MIALVDLQVVEEADLLKWGSTASTEMSTSEQSRGCLAIGAFWWQVSLLIIAWYTLCFPSFIQGSSCAPRVEYC